VQKTTDMTAKKKAPGVAEEGMSDNKLIGYGAIFTGLAVSVLSAGLVGTLKAVAGAGADMHGFSQETIISAFLKTLPLSVAVTLIVFCALRGWVNESFQGILLAFGILAACTILLHPDGMKAGIRMISISWQQRASGLFGFPARLVAEYVAVYWWKPFVSGLLSGSLAGWAMWLKTSKYLDKT
jgi:hypothetical protein